jgi:hypothetical protein
MKHLDTTLTNPALLPERWTLIAMSSLAYILAVALHEHAGHTAACVLLGGRPLEMGAFYVNCDNARLSPLGIRLVALAGPLVSLLLGLASFAILARLRDAPAMAYFIWLLGSLGLMDGTGYLLFSGVSGLGDLGTAYGALFGAQPAWLWRLVLTLSGALLYAGAVFFSVARLEPHLSGKGPARLALPRRAALVSYFVGAATYVIVSAFNPYGWQIVLISALPSSMGGTSGLLWMFQVADRNRSGTGSGLAFERRWSWIIVGLLVTITYSLVFARTLRWPAALAP